MIPPFKAILFLEPHLRIRSLFDSFWGISKIHNSLIHFSTEQEFWEQSPDDCALLIVDLLILDLDPVEWTKILKEKRPLYQERVIWVVETKEERDRLVALGLTNVLRLPFQWSQWLPVICKFGLKWRLWRG